MKEVIAVAGLLALVIALAIVLSSRLRHEPQADPVPAERAIGQVIQTLNAEEGRHWRRTGGDAAGTIDLRDSFDYRNDTEVPVDDPFLATMVIHPRDTEGRLYTANVSAGNYRTQRALPFIKSRNRNTNICVDFEDTGAVVTREHDLASYQC